MFMSFVGAFIALLLCVTANAESKNNNCFAVSITIGFWSRRIFCNFQAGYEDRCDVVSGHVEYHLLDQSGNVIMASNSSTSRVCLNNNNECQFLFLSGNGEYHVTAANDNDNVTDDDNDLVIAEGEISYDSPKLLRMGNCAHYCGDDKHQLTFVGKSDDAPTLYDSNDNVLTEGLFHNNNSDTEKEEEIIVMQTLCIHPTECYRLTGSALFVVSNRDGNATTVKEGTTYHGYETFGDDNNCRYRCNDKPLLAETKRGQEILLAVSSISESESLRNVHSPQFRAACWLIYDDPLEVNPFDYNLIQRYVLAVVYYSLNGTGWHRNLDFLSARHECSWNRWVSHLRQFYVGDDDGDGIHCGSSGHVSGMVLKSNNLDGTMPFEVSFLSHTEYLDISDNSISGSIPSQLGIMRKCHTIELEANFLTGSVPDSIGAITILRRLNLALNLLTGSLPWHFHGDLEYLDIGGNMMTGTITDDIGQLTSMRWLRLSGNHISGTIPAGIGSLSLLEDLAMQRNDLSGTLPQNLLTLLRLTRLTLDDNELSGSIPNQVAHQDRLYMLTFGNNYLTGAIPPEISRLSGLQRLDLENNNLSGEIPQSLKNLTSLGMFLIYRNNLTGVVPFENCDETYYDMQADCDTPQKVVCPCCSRCHGMFTMYDDEMLECTSAKLTLRFDRVSSPAIFLMDSFGLSSGAMIYLEYVSPMKIVNGSYTATTCVAMSGCFNMGVSGSNLHTHTTVFETGFDIELLINNHVVLQEHVSMLGNFDFGWSADGSMQKDTCDDYKLCNFVAATNSSKRKLMDKLTRITGTEVFNDASSSHYQAACRFVAFLQEKDDDDFKHSELLQHFYLTLFYFDTGGEQWINSTSWTTTTPFCSWHGIKCDKYGVVTSLSLPSNNLLGTLSSEIAELRGLQHVLLNDNNLYGTLPLEVGMKLQRLKEFNVSNNRLWGSVPSEFSLLTDIEAIDISQNEFSGSIPADIGMMENIQILNFFQNTLAGELPDSFYDLTTLKVLNLASNLLYGDAGGFENFLDLELLDLSGNFFSGTVPLGSHQKKLRRLILSSNSFRGSIPTSVEQLSSLEELFLHNNQITGNLPSQVGNLIHLVRISVSDNEIKSVVPSEIGYLKNLTLLHLQNNLFEGSGDVFDYEISDYISDCGNTFTGPARVECSNCSSCCNVHGDCLSKEITWPGRKVSVLRISAPAFVLLVALAACVFLLMCVQAYPFVHNETHDIWNGHEFQVQSVYRFFLTNNIGGNIVAAATLSIQLLLLVVFLGASDFTAIKNDWEYSMSCPSDSIGCQDSRLVSPVAWFGYCCIMLTYLANDLAESIKMIYQCVVVKSHRKGLVAGFVVLYVTICSAVVSGLYSHSTGISNTDILKDAVLLLFLIELDERCYLFIKMVRPNWVKDCNREIEVHNLGAHANTDVRQQISRLDAGTRVLSDLNCEADNLNHLLNLTGVNEELKVATLRLRDSAIPSLKNDLANLEIAHAESQSFHNELEQGFSTLEQEFCKIKLGFGQELRDLKEIVQLKCSQPL